MDPNDQALMLVVWLVGATIVAWIASSQGRSPITWFLIGVMFSPVLGFVAVVLSAPRRAS